MSDPNMQDAFGAKSAPGTKAATGPEVAHNPAAYEGGSQDPVEMTVPVQATRTFGSGNYSGPMKFADWYREEPEAAMLWLTQQLNATLNFGALSTAQKTRMGIPGL